MTSYNKDLGKRGEEIVKNHLEEAGYLIIDKNVYFWGGEIDLVAIKDDLLHFIEVKTRINSNDLHISELLSHEKMKSLLRSVRLYLFKKNFDDIDAQIDLFLVRFYPNQSFKIESLKNITF